MNMEVIVCQTCEEIIGYQEADKAGKLYSTCCDCHTELLSPVEMKDSCEH